MIKLMFEAGLRVSEAVSLTMNHFDVSKRYLRIPAEMTGNKARQDFVIGVNKDTMADILKLMDGEDKGARLFPFNRKTAHMHVFEIGKKVLEKNCYPHMLRHSLATFLLRQGMDLLDVKTQMRHKNIATTSIYLVADPVAAVKKTEAIFDEMRRSKE